jgi:hypothetical protein
MPTRSRNTRDEQASLQQAHSLNGHKREHWQSGFQYSQEEQVHWLARWKGLKQKYLLTTATSLAKLHKQFYSAKFKKTEYPHIFITTPPQQICLTVPGVSIRLRRDTIPPRSTQGSSQTPSRVGWVEIAMDVMMVVHTTRMSSCQVTTPKGVVV